MDKEKKGLMEEKGGSERRSVSKIARGYFGIGRGLSATSVHVTSSEDFLVYIWARNIEISSGGLQISTPPSQFRSGSQGEHDGLVLDIPAQTGMDLGCIGAQGGETIDLTNAGGARVVVFLTVVTEYNATINMSAAV